MAKTFSELQSPDARTREQAVVNLSKGRVSIRIVRQLLDDQDRFVRNAALERLMDWEAAGALPDVVRKLRDPFDVARITALECIAYWGSDEHGQLIAPLLTDPSPLVRAYAAWTMGELDSPKLLSRLRRRLKSEYHPTPRAALHEVLFRFTGDDRHLQALLRALRSVNYRAACFAARSLSNCASTEKRDVILDALRHAVSTDERLAVRETAAKSIETIRQRGPHNLPLQPTSRKQGSGKSKHRTSAARG